MRRRRGPESAALPLKGNRLYGQQKEPPAALFAVRAGRAALTKARQRRPVPPSVAEAAFVSLARRIAPAVVGLTAGFAAEAALRLRVRGLAAAFAAATLAIALALRFVTGGDARFRNEMISF